MILMYMLFALTVSAILTALISEHITQKGQGEAFVVFFVALMIVAWVVDEWVLPDLARGHTISWLPIALLIMFSGIFAASTILSVRNPRPLRQSVVYYKSRFDAEAMVFDVIFWFALLTIGIVVLRSVGL